MADMNASDVALLTREADGFGGMGGGWMLALFVLLILGGGWGGFGNGNGFANAIGYENLATSNEVQRGFDNQNSMANQREILAAVNAGTLQGVQTTQQTFHDTLAALSDKYQEITRDIGGLAVGQANSLAKLNECCCSIQRAIDGVNYNTALQTAQVVQAIHEDGEKTRNMQQQNRYDDLLMKYNEQGRRMNTQEVMGAIGAATANVVRYPTGFTYNAGPSPFCSGFPWGPGGNV